MWLQVFVVGMVFDYFLNIVVLQIFCIELRIEFIGIGNYQSGTYKAVDLSVPEIALKLLEQLSVIQSLYIHQIRVQYCRVASLLNLCRFYLSSATIFILTDQFCVRYFIQDCLPVGFRPFGLLDPYSLPWLHPV